MVINQFLNAHCNPARPFLLALSGGTDSLPLYHLLKGKKFAVAHVDHGWRAESADEAEQLRRMVEADGIVFHCHSLRGKALEGNIEAACRRERQGFFKRLCDEHGYQAVMLGHHQMDQAETVLKRVFEGNSLTTISGMREVTEIEGVIYWRPLLSTPKEEIQKWVEAMELEPFYDRTNSDPSFMRGAMRTQIVPRLSKEFGKQIQEPLIRIAKESELLAHYIDHQLTSYTIQREALGMKVAIPESLHPYEKIMLIRRFCSAANVVPTHNQVEQLREQLDKPSSKIVVGGHTLIVDRGVLYLPKEVKLPESAFKLMEGEWSYGPWRLKVSTRRGAVSPTGWSDAWSGFAEVTLPLDEYMVAPHENILYPGTNPISKWWTNHKVPAFMRSRLPVVWSGESIRHEFLTGKVKSFDDNLLNCLHLEITWSG